MTVFQQRNNGNESMVIVLAMRIAAQPTAFTLSSPVHCWSVIDFLFANQDRVNIIMKGQCLCSAVSFSMDAVGNFGVCHCQQCQRWTGGPLLAVTVLADAMSINGAEHIVSRRTSAWASRSHCGICGSPLWYRHDRGIDDSGNYEVPIGLLDNANGLTLEREIFIDRKPDSFEFAGDHKRLTEAETLAMYGVESENS